jgi:hypothetical protein
VQSPQMTSSPVVQQVPVEIVPPDLPETAVAAPAAPAPRATARTAAAPARTSATVAPSAEPASNTDMSSPAVESAAIEPVIVPSPVAADPVAPAAAEITQPADNSSTALLAGLLAAIGIAALAIWGFVAIGRRKQVRAKVPVVERPKVAGPVPQPVLAEPALREDIVSPPLAATVAPLAAPRMAAAGGLAHTGASVALPRSMPATYEERDALMRRMIEAKPDRANPFASPKARARRARLILQSLGRDFGGREPWIDLSQYAANWPSAQRRTASAA